MTVQTLPILYSFRRCPYAMRARLALSVSGQTCELREVVLRSKPEALLTVSPKGTVPVLVLPDGSVIEQSLEIMQWALSNHDPESWLTPTHATDETMHQLINLCDGPFKSNLDRYKYPNRYDNVDAIEHRTLASTYLSELDQRLREHAYLCGTLRSSVFTR
jgi:glutathione S-transferase